jgi:glycosyltransferase involved in cell wall biosynthesis
MNSPPPLETGESAFEPIAVMQVIDTLDSGGMERVAVNLANLLPRHRYAVHLCTTRREGALAELVAPDVSHLGLGRRRRFDVLAVRRLALYIRRNRIAVVHAHGTALFVAVLGSLLSPAVRILWHDHFGRFGIEKRPAWLYRLAVARIHGVIAVTQPLADWARRVLGVAPQRVWYLPNFASTPPLVTPAPDLPGEPGNRIVCVANLRHEKDHLTLLTAMRIVFARTPRAHLLLVGGAGNQAYRQRIEKEISQGNLAGRVSWLGSRSDVAAILKACDIGVLSSVSEGLPLALIEYGLAGLAAVATRVGQCEEVLAEGRAGLLVPPASPAELAMAILSLLESPERRRALAARLVERVRERYGEEQALEQVCKIYDAVLGRHAAPAAA